MAEVKKFLDQAGVDAFWEKVKAQAAAAQSAAEAKATEVADDLAANYYNKTSVDSKISEVNSKITALGSVLNFKGTVATTAALPTTENKTGDVYHVTEKSAEYVWDGTQWEELGSTIDLSGYLTKTDAANTYVKSDDLNSKIDARVPLTGVQFNGTDLTITNKKVNVQAATTAQGAKADTALQPDDIVAIPTTYINALS